MRPGPELALLTPAAPPRRPAPQTTSPSTLSVAMHLCPALSLMRSILGASMRQLQRGSSSNPRSVSREDVSLDTPWTGRNRGDEGLAPHPPEGFLPSHPAAPSHSRTLKPGMDTPALEGFPSTPVGTPSGSLPRQLAINYQRGWGRGSPRWAAPGTPEEPPCTHWALRSPHHSLLTQRQRE